MRKIFGNDIQSVNKINILIVPKIYQKKKKTGKKCIPSIR